MISRNGSNIISKVVKPFSKFANIIRELYLNKDKDYEKAANVYYEWIQLFLSEDVARRKKLEIDNLGRELTEYEIKLIILSRYRSKYIDTFDRFGALENHMANILYFLELMKETRNDQIRD
ncbi:MAG: hypothetical protein ARM1_0724 [Candidatus Micrarchaeota archaeon]|nr:MAG: hypothetical protein ARM1_0724 [Candidatus Micrarchaeota archaeon]